MKKYTKTSALLLLFLAVLPAARPVSAAGGPSAGPVVLAVPEFSGAALSRTPELGFSARVLTDAVNAALLSGGKFRIFTGDGLEVALSTSAKGGDAPLTTAAPVPGERPAAGYAVAGSISDMQLSLAGDDPERRKKPARQLTIFADVRITRAADRAIADAFLSEASFTAERDCFRKGKLAYPGRLKQPMTKGLRSLGKEIAAKIMESLKAAGEKVK